MLGGGSGSSSMVTRGGGQKQVCIEKKEGEDAIDI